MHVNVLSHTSAQKLVNTCALSAPGSALVDLMGLITPASGAPANPESSSLQSLTKNTGISLLDDELGSLGKQKEERKNSWLVNLNGDDQALNKQKKIVSNPPTAQGHIRPHSQKNAAFMNMALATPDVMTHKMVQKCKAMSYN